MRTIHVAGPCSGSGKTLLLAAAIPAVPGWGAVKVSYHADARHGPPAVVLDPGVLDRPGTDTARYRAAGAACTAWVRATPPTLAPLLAEVRAILGDLPGLWFEGTAAWRLAPAEPLAVVVPVPGGTGKPGFDAVLAAAGLVVIHGQPGEEPAGVDPTDPRIVRADLREPADPGCRRAVDRLVTWSRG